MDYKPISQVRWLVYDYGNYISVAQKLAEMSAIVYYFNPSIITGYPDHKPRDIGRNVLGIIPVKEYETIIDNIDAVYFPDVHEPNKQFDFIKRGKFVFGCMFGSKLELDRAYLRNKMAEVGLPVIEWGEANGLDELREALKENEDVWIKSELRGDMETWHSDNYLLSKDEIDEMQSHLTAYSQQEKYIWERSFKSIAEIGYDGFCVDGLFPKTCITGPEIKDLGYVGMVMDYKSLPKQIRNVNDKLSDAFREFRYRGPVSTEVMIGENLKGYLTDITARHPQPPTDLYIEMIEDYADVAWKIAQGIVPEIKWKYKYGVQLIIKSETAKSRSIPFIIPDEYKQYVKIKNLVIAENGLYYYSYQGIPMAEVGSVSGMANSLKEAIKMGETIAKSIKGFDIKINTDCLGEANKQFDKLSKAGINYIN
jgi:hypothetical protein